MPRNVHLLRCSCRRNSVAASLLLLFPFALVLVPLLSGHQPPPHFALTLRSQPLLMPPLHMSPPQRSDSPRSLLLLTAAGNITIAFSPSAPATVASLIRSVRTLTCSACQFVRNEAVPPPSLPLGPPYALLQGQLPGILDCSLPVEPSRTISRGDVAAINGAANTNGDFFISLGRHDDWAPSFTVWGRVSTGMHVVEQLVQREYRHTLHTSGTAMRMLAVPVTFAVALT